MASIWCCGIECGLLGSLGEHWTAGTGWSVSTSTIRNGDRALRYNPSAASATIVANAGASGTTKVWRQAIRFTTLPGADCILSWYDYSGSSAGIGFKASDSKLYAAVEIAGVITFGATGVAVTTDVWYVLDAKTVGSVVTGTADGRVNGTALGQATGAFAGANSTNLSLGSNGVSITADVFHDDFLVSETSGDYPFGDGYVDHFVPTSDGAHAVGGASSFRKGDAGANISDSTTDAYLLIDDVPLPSGSVGTTDFIENVTFSTGNAEYCEFVIGPAPGTPTPTTGPRGVQVILAHHSASAAALDWKCKLNDNGTLNDAVVFAATGPGTTFNYAGKHYALAPSTGAAWTSGLFNALRMRWGYTSDATPDPDYAAFMIEAEFASDSGVTSTAAITLPAITAAASATQTTFTSTAAITLPAITAAAAMTQTNTAAGTVALPAITAAASVTQTNTLAGATTLPALSAAASMEVVLAFLEGTVALPALTAAAIATQTQAATATVALPALTAAAVVTMLPDLVGGVTLPALTAAAAATQTQQLTAAVTLPAISAAAAATQGMESAAAVTLPAITAQATVAQTNTLAGTIALPALTAAAQVTQSQLLAGSVALPAVTAVASATQTISAAAAALLPAITALAAAGVVPTATAAVTLPMLVALAALYAEVGLTAMSLGPGSAAAGQSGEGTGRAGQVGRGSGRSALSGRGGGAAGQAQGGTSRAGTIGRGSGHV